MTRLVMLGANFTFLVIGLFYNCLLLGFQLNYSEFEIFLVQSVNEVPEMLHHRYLSVRGYNPDSMMVDASVTEAVNLRGSIDEIFDNKEVEYIHIPALLKECRTI